MPERMAEEKMKKVHYSWIVCAACTLLMFCSVGLASTAFSVYQPYLISVNGFTNSQASLIVTIRAVTSVLTLLITDRVIRFLKPRKCAFVALILEAVGFLIYAFAKSYLVYCIGAALVGVTMSIGGIVLVSMIIAQWFDSSQGKALGICAAGSGLATIICPPVIAEIIANMSLGKAFLMEAVVILAIGIVIFLILKNDPSEKDLRPYRKKAEAEVSAVSYGKGLSGTNYVLTMLCMLFLGFAGNVAVIHRSALYATSGFDSMTVASFLSICGFVLVVGKYVYGAATDRMGGYKANYLFVSLLLIAMVMECFAGYLPVSAVYISEVILGMGFPVLTLGGTIAARELADQEQFSEIVKNYTTMFQLGSIFASILPGVIADMTGSYVPAFIFAAILAAVYEIGMQVVYIRNKKMN